MKIFSSRPEFPRFCFKSIRTDEEQGKIHYHDGSLLLLNTTFLSFLSTLNGCCDASEINILVNILKQINFSALNNLYAALNLSLRHLAIDRANNRSFPISSQLNRREVPTFSPRVGHLKI